MEMFLVGLVGAMVAGWIVRPLFGKPSEVLKVSSSDNADLLEAKQSVYRGLIDLEMDHEQGKLTEQDYRQLQLEGKQEALSLIQQIEGSEPAETTLEEEIRAARSRLRRE
ncbi:MAG: hypothetical protein ACT4OM_10790 [Actinomycetota bacterium]